MTFFDQLNAHGKGVGVVVVAPPPGLEPEQLLLQLRVLEMLNVEDPASAIQRLEGSYTIRLGLVGPSVAKLFYGQVNHFLLHPLFEHCIEEFPRASCLYPNCPWPPLLVQSLHGPHDLEWFPLTPDCLYNSIGLVQTFSFHAYDKNSGVVALFHGV